MAGPSKERRAEIVRRVDMLRAEIKSHEDEVKELLKEAAFEVDTYNFDGLLVSVTPTRRFDPALAEKVLNKKQFAMILKEVPDSKKAEALFPEKFDAMKKDYGVTVKISRKDG